MGGWITIPGCRKSGLRPWPSLGKIGLAPAGWKRAVSCSPCGESHSRAKGFSKKTTSERKKARVTIVVTTTQGRRSRSRSHLRRPTAGAKAAISHDQNTSEPAFPPNRCRANDPLPLLGGLERDLLLVAGRTLEQQLVGVKHAVLSQSPGDNGLRLIAQQIRPRAHIDHVEPARRRVDDGLVEGSGRPPGGA